LSPLDRRTFLRLTATATCAACVPLAGCRSDVAAEAGPLLVNLDELPDGGRVRREWAGRPLELRRRGAEVTVRSLLCTHQGCEVVWRAESRDYHCPCHEGRFDAEGRPVYGPPRRPLRIIEATVRDGVVVVES
jgi:Rieske Fe-S protein